MIKLKSMKVLAPDFEKACVDIFNARAEILESESGTVPPKIIVKQEKVEHPEES